MLNWAVFDQKWAKNAMNALKPAIWLYIHCTYMMYTIWYLQKFNWWREALYLLHTYYGVLTLLFTGSFISGCHTLEACISKKDCHMIKNGACTCSLGRGIWFFTFRMNFELRGLPAQPPTCQIFSQLDFGLYWGWIEAGPKLFDMIWSLRG